MEKLCLRILQVVQRFPPCDGGAERYARDVSGALSRRGHKVVVFTSNWVPNHLKRKGLLSSSGLPPYDKSSGYEVRRFGVLYFGRQGALGSYDHLIPGLVPSLLRTHPDVIHIHSYGCFHSDTAARVAIARRIPYVLTPHGFFQSVGFRRLVKSAYDVFVGRFTIRNASRLFAFTPFDAQFFLKLGADPRQVQVVPPGLDLEAYNMPVDSSEFRAQFGISGKMILYAGRLEARKGPQHLLRAAPFIERMESEACFVFVGRDWGCLAELKRLSRELKIEHHTIFTGHLQDSPFKQALACADVFVLPSEVESSPQVVLEAQASGVPVVATDVGGVRYLVEHEKTGLIVPPGDVVSLAESICRILQNPSLSRALSHEARCAVERKFALSRVAHELEMTYEEVCAVRR